VNEHPASGRILCSLLRQPVTVRGLAPLGHGPGETEVKGYGYGTPVRVDYETAEGEKRSAVIHTMESGPFGHEHMADRAQILLWSIARSTVFRGMSGPWTSPVRLRRRPELSWKRRRILPADRICRGEGYFRDLERILETGAATALDFAAPTLSAITSPDSPEAGESAGAVYSAHPRTGGTWGVHHGTGRFLSVAPGDYA